MIRARGEARDLVLLSRGLTGVSLLCVRRSCSKQPRFPESRDTSCPSAYAGIMGMHFGRCSCALALRSRDPVLSLYLIVVACVRAPPYRTD